MYDTACDGPPDCVECDVEAWRASRRHIKPHLRLHYNPLHAYPWYVELIPKREGQRAARDTTSGYSNVPSALKGARIIWWGISL